MWLQSCNKNILYRGDDGTRSLREYSFCSLSPTFVRQIVTPNNPANYLCHTIRNMIDYEIIDENLQELFLIFQRFW